MRHSLGIEAQLRVSRPSPADAPPIEELREKDMRGVDQVRVREELPLRYMLKRIETK
jgi:hypothetical protein